MKKHSFLIILVLMSLIFLPVNAQEQRKLAQAGMKFLSVSTDARVSGMGTAVTSLFGTSSSLLYNPAGIAEQKKMVDISFGQTKWIADINYTHATATFNPFGDYYGIFGISVVSVDYGDFIGTIRSDNEAGYIDVGNFSPKAMAIGLTYARALSEKFSIGGTVKYVTQNLIDNAIVGNLAGGGYLQEKFKLDAMAFDFGLLYRTGFKSLNIGMSVRNFSQEIKYKAEGFQMPLTFKLGASMDLMDMFDVDKANHSFLFTVDAGTPRDYEEQISVGGEYTFLNTFMLRAGYTTPTDEAGLSLGFGIKKELANILMQVDYSYTKFGIFGDVHQFGVSLAY